ncbi:MAG: selenide, water dikinase SelD [Pseudomonadota bacterium]
MTANIPLTRDLVLIGGGHTHALVLRKWGMTPLPGVRLTVINPGPTAPYSGMLPGFVASHYTREELNIDLVRLCRFAGARLIDGRASAIDRDARMITVPGRPPVGYDVAALDIGITSAMPALKGFAEHGIPAKPLGPFAARWDAFRNEAASPKVAIIGGGVAGAELSMAMAHALKGRSPQITLIDRGPILDGFNPAAHARLMAALDEHDVTCVESANVVEVTRDAVHLADGTRIASDFTTGAAGARPQPWMAEIGIDMHEGFVAVGKSLQSSDPDIFAVGDCAHMTHAPRPKAGVFAVRQAPVLYDNLRARLMSKPTREFWPQKDYLKLISLGDQEALAEKFGTARRGKLLWRWKDKIDRAFMDQFDDLAMPDADLPLNVADGVRDMSEQMLCGGCGAKVGRGALEAVLTPAGGVARPDVVNLPGDDAALLTMGETRQVLTTDHLSAVTDDPVTMARITVTHAMGDIWAMGAAPQAALVSLILPRMSAELQRRTVSEINAVVTQALGEAGAALVGGHTTQGENLTIGLSITGLLDRDPITLSGARPGDVLILTKPIGSGTILAAAMRGLARGEDVVACHDAMIQPQAKAAEVLSGAHAMTDVTGFGLAGHLDGMCRASGVGAAVRLRAVPLMDGALDLARSGVRSSLHPDNRRDVAVETPDTDRSALMFDPQTGGGLLAAVDPRHAEDCLQQLVDAGYEAACIGDLTENARLRFTDD